MGGRREVSIISRRPVTRGDLKQEGSFFVGVSQQSCNWLSESFIPLYHAPKEVDIKNSISFSYVCVPRLCLCGNMQEIGLLKEARGKRCHTIVRKPQRKGFLVLKRYKDEKN